VAIRLGGIASTTCAGSGTFSDFEARLSEGALVGTAEVASVEVKDPNLAAHLQGPDFFDAERFPRLSFDASEIGRSGDELTITGELTLKGRTEPVELSGHINDPAPDPYGGERLGLQLEAKVDRTKFGLNWNNPLPSGDPARANEVTIVVDLQLVKRRPAAHRCPRAALAAGRRQWARRPGCRGRPRCGEDARRRGPWDRGGVSELVQVGVSHASAPVGWRERLAIAGNAVGPVAARLALATPRSGWRVPRNSPPWSCTSSTSTTIARWPRLSSRASASAGPTKTHSGTCTSVSQRSGNARVARRSTRVSRSRCPGVLRS
jgi:polyisoprenoid-binding protein YceI